MKFNRTKCKVLHVGWNNPIHHCSLGADCLGSSSAQGPCGQQAKHEPALHPRSEGGQPRPWLYQHTASWTREAMLPVFSICEIAVLCPIWACPEQEEHGCPGACPVETTELVSSFSTGHIRRGCDCWICSADRKDGSRETLLLSATTLPEERGKLFSEVHSDRMRDNRHKLEYENSE